MADRTSIPKEARVYGLRWVAVIKNPNEEMIEKSRLVARKCCDHVVEFMAEKSPTVSSVGKVVLAALPGTLSGHSVYIGNIFQAYLESESTLERKVYQRTPS